MKRKLAIIPEIEDDINLAIYDNHGNKLGYLDKDFLYTYGSNYDFVNDRYTINITTRIDSELIKKYKKKKKKKINLINL